MELKWINPLRSHGHLPHYHTGGCGISFSAIANEKQCRVERTLEEGWLVRQNAFIVGSHLEGLCGVWAGMVSSCCVLLTLFCFCFRIKWFQCALIWQSDSPCHGTIFRSAATPQHSLHGLTIPNAGHFSRSLFSHNAQASFFCLWCGPKCGTCEFWLAWPRINGSSSHRSCKHGYSKIVDTPHHRPSASGFGLTHPEPCDVEITQRRPAWILHVWGASGSCGKIKPGKSCSDPGRSPLCEGVCLPFISFKSHDCRTEALGQGLPRFHCRPRVICSFFKAWRY